MWESGKARQGPSTNASRTLAAVSLVTLGLLLAILQFFASIALASRAQPGSWMRLLSAPTVQGLTSLGERLPLPNTLRLAFAREALGAGDRARAAADLAALPAGPDVLAVRAALARANGDLESALHDDLAASDYTSLTIDLDGLVARGELGRALAYQRLVVARLSARRTAPDALAEADYHLGIYEEARAQTFPAHSREYRAHGEAAAAAYARASALGPLDERYVLAAGSQALNLGAWADAAATFERARALDPTSADPLAGLGDLAFRRGDLASARAFLARARALEPRSVAVQRLALKLRQ